MTRDQERIQELERENAELRDRLDTYAWENGPDLVKPSKHVSGQCRCVTA